MPDGKTTLDESIVFTQMGSTGLKVNRGVIHDEFLTDLKGHRRYKIFTEMRNNDATVGAVLYVIESLLKQVVYDMQPASQDPEDIEIADFVKTCMHDMADSWESNLSEILAFLPLGYSIHEIVYKQRTEETSKFNDNRIGWKYLMPLAQDTIERWLYDEDEIDLVGLEQRNVNKFELVHIPIAKTLLFRPTSHKRNPEGRSVLRTAYRSWYFKKRIEEIEGVGIERDLAGIPVMKVPAEIMGPNASDNGKVIFNTCKELVKNIRRDEQESVLIPSDVDVDSGKELYSLELLTTGGTRQFDTSAIIDRYDRRILMSLLADFLMLGADSTGSFALSDDKTDLFATSLNSFLKAIVEPFNCHGIPQLVALNGWRKEQSPTMTFGDIESPDLLKLGDFITKMISTGVLFPDEPLEDHVRAAANLPQRIADDGDFF